MSLTKILSSRLKKTFIPIRPGNLIICGSYVYDREKNVRIAMSYQIKNKNVFIVLSVCNDEDVPRGNVASYDTYITNIGRLVIYYSTEVLVL